jgi:hypothetical protein
VGEGRRCYVERYSFIGTYYTRARTVLFKDPPAIHWQAGLFIRVMERMTRRRALVEIVRPLCESDGWDWVLRKGAGRANEPGSFGSEQRLRAAERL